MHYRPPKSASQAPLCPSDAPQAKRSDDDIGGGASTRSVRPLVLMVNSRPPHATDPVTGEVLTFNVKNGVPTKIKEYSQSDARHQRYQLQSLASKCLLPYFPKGMIKSNGHQKTHATVDCHRVQTSTFVDVHKSTEHESCFFGQLSTCRSVWTCPVCSTKICERRSHELRIAFNQAQAMNLQISLWTFTAPHNASDRIQKLLPMISDALTKFSSGKPFLKFRQNFSIIGRIRSTEVRYGVNGWHPHFHLIFFSKKSLLDQKEWALKRWQSMCLKSGLSCPNEYGLDIRDGSKAGEYINKFSPNGEIINTKDGQKVGWDLADEATKGMKKGSKGGTLSPWCILQLSGDHPDIKQRKKYQRLFLSYARAFHGKRQLHWGSLKKFFDIEEKSDSDLIEEKDETAKLIGHITKSEWQQILKRDERSAVLTISENGGNQSLIDYLHQFSDLSLIEYTIQFNSRGSFAI